MATKRKSAYLQATQEAQQSQQTVTPESGSTVKPFQSDTGTQQNSNTVEPFQSDTALTLQGNTALPRSSRLEKKEEKVTFYLTSGQADKLDDLAYEHKKRTGKRINRNNIVRYLIDICTAETISSID